MNSNEDMLKMQQDAIRRVKEMHARAKMSVEGTRPASKVPIPEHGNDFQGNNLPQKISKVPVSHNKTKHHQNNNPLKFLDALIKDEEKTLILILLILLSGEEDNIGIILTLIYLLI